MTQPKTFHTGQKIPAGGSHISLRAAAPASRDTRTTPPFHLGSNIPAGGSAPTPRAPTPRATAPLPRTNLSKRLPSLSVGRGQGWGATGGYR